MPQKLGVVVVALCASALVCVAVGVGCGGGEAQSWGEAVDPAVAIPLARILARDGGDRTGEVTASGRIGEVCRSAGCWFVLQDTSAGSLGEVVVDLKPRASFTIPRQLQGREAVVRGYLVGNKPDLRFDAVGLLVR